MSQIVSLATAVPPFRQSQAEIGAFMARHLPLPEPIAAKLFTQYERSGIGWRHSVIPDYSCPQAEWRFFPQHDSLGPTPSLEDRMVWYQREALPLAQEALEKCLAPRFQPSDLTHLITVSCTGMAAPGLDIELVTALKLSPAIARTAIHFMGCYAALHALKQADAICRANPHALVAIVCVELCTLHFQTDTSPDTLTANLLFADGAAAALVAGRERAMGLPGLALEGFASWLELDGEKDMAWKLSSQGFLMTLSSYVPSLIQRGIRPLVARALEQLGLPLEAIHHWALHPGGRKILDVAADSLALLPGSLDSSYRVLHEYGNMSSPTVLFVLDDLMRTRLPQVGEGVLALAFGPGLTMESAVMRVC